MRRDRRRSGEKRRHGLRSCERQSRRGSARNGHIEIPARAPMRCGFGAVRVGALLGRVRLHLQTDRFLAVHRNDAVWAASCLQAAAALAEIVSRMLEGEMDAALPQDLRQRRTGELPHSDREEPVCPGMQGPFHPSECEGWGTRKTFSSGASSRSGGTLRRTTTPKQRAEEIGAGAACAPGTPRQTAPGATFAAAGNRGAR
jgi:hypothetical protein